MSSRLYFTNKSPEHFEVTSKGNGAWDTWAGTYTPYMLDSNKYGDPPSTLDIVIPRTTSPQRIGCYVGISRALLPGSTFVLKWNAFLAVAQTTLSQTYTRIHAYTLDTTAGLNNGILHRIVIDKYEENPVGGPFIGNTEWPFVPNSLTPPKLPIEINKGLTEGVIQIPDDGKEYRLVVEIGAISYATNDIGIQHRFGARNDDLSPKEDIVTPDGATYIDIFASSVVFDEYKGFPPNHEIELAEEIQLGTLQINNVPFRHYPRWYKYTPPFNAALSMQAYSESGGGSTLWLYMAKDLGQIHSTPVKYWGESGENVVFNHAIQLNRQVFIKTNTVNVGTFNWALVLAIASAGILPGNLYVSSDDFNVNLYNLAIQGLYPSIWHNTVVGDVQTLSGQLPATKVGVSLRDGTWALSQPFTGEIFILRRAPFSTLQEHIFTELTSGITSMGTDMTDFWMLGVSPTFNSGSNKTVIKIDKGGNIDTRHWTLEKTTGGGALNGAASMGVSRDAATLYYNDYIDDGKVQRHNLLTDLPLAPFASNPSVDYRPEDIIVLKDNTIVCLFRHRLGFGFGPDVIVQYNPSGTVLHSYQQLNATVHHICHNQDDDPAFIWALKRLLNQSTGLEPSTNLFQRIRLSDGVVVNSFGITYVYNNGRGPSIATGSETQPRWGTPFKGSLIPMMIPADISGLYFLNGAKKHDTYNNNVEYRIPDPTIRTALLGE